MNRPGAESSSAAFDLAQRLPLGVVIFDGNSLVSFANSSATRLLKFPTLRAMPMQEVILQLGPACASLAKLASGQRVVILVGGLLLEVEAQKLDDDSVMWLVQDKSEELRLRSQFAEEASLLAHGHEAFLVVEHTGLIRYANAVCERVMGFGPGALVGCNLFDFERAISDTFESTEEISADDMRKRLEQVVQHGVVHRYNAWHRRNDSSEFPVEVSMRPYRMSQETVVLTTIRDESRRLQHLQDLVEAKAMAEAANRAKSAFLAITSHELRTPLTSIIGFCELLQLEYGDQQNNLANYLKLISESSQSLLNIISDILDLSKLEAKTMDIKVEPMDPDHLLDLMQQLWEPRAKAKGLQFIRLPSTGEQRPFYSDPLRLRQVMENLITNAIKFTEAGRIEIQLEHREDELVFTVADTGRGIPSEVHHQLFQPFWQLADATTRSAGGTGLGLHICKQIVSLLGGTIWLDRSSPEGTAFKVRLPRNVQGQTGLHRSVVPPHKTGNTARISRKTTNPNQ